MDSSRLYLISSLSVYILCVYNGFNLTIQHFNLYSRLEKPVTSMILVG